MKKLVTAVKALNSDTRIKVGAKDGSAFFYVGTAGDFLENLEAYNSECEGETIRKYRNAKKEYERYASGDPGSIEAFIRLQSRRETPVITFDGYLEFLRQYFHQLEVRRSVLRTRTADKENYKHLRNRGLVEAYKADPVADPDCDMILITTGVEYGGYWLTSEVQKPIAFAGWERLSNELA